MTTWQLLRTAWVWEPSVYGGCAILLAGYAALTRPLGPRALTFLAGVVTLLLALVSPLDLLGDGYLFSAHMTQHLLLTLVVPPLLILGLPPVTVGRLLTRPGLRRLEGQLARPYLAWTLATATLWLWHLPALYEAALRHAGIHIAQHLSFLATATLFWWPVLAPSTARARLAPWTALLYLAVAGVASTLLGILLTFAPAGFYPSYLAPTDPLGILPLLRDGWGLTPAGDQQLGGILMWIPGGLLYSLFMLSIFARWVGGPDDDQPVAAPGWSGS